MDVRSVLLGAKAEVSNGWVQNRLIVPGQGVCLMGAVLVGCGWNGNGKCVDFVSSSRPPARELAVTAGVGHGYLASWNDSPGRTQAEVVDLIDRTLARLAEQERIEDSAAVTVA